MFGKPVRMSLNSSGTVEPCFVSVFVAVRLSGAVSHSGRASKEPPKTGNRHPKKARSWRHPPISNAQNTQVSSMKRRSWRLAWFRARFKLVSNLFRGTPDLPNFLGGLGGASLRGPWRVVPLENLDSGFKSCLQPSKVGPPSMPLPPNKKQAVPNPFQ